MNEKQVVPKVRVWIKSEGCFADYVESIRYYSSDIDLWYEPFRYTDIHSNYEVIGNIYENEDEVGYGDE